MSDDPFELFVRPDRVAEFFANHWERAALHVPGDAARWTALYDVAHWHARRHLGATDAARVDEHGRQHQRRIDVAAIDAALAEGATVCADVSTTPGLARVLELLQTRVPGPEPAFAKLYASPPGVGFALHMDAHHVFVLQLEGRKRWTYSPRPAVTATLVGGTLAHGRAVHTFPREGAPIIGDDGRALEVPRPDELVEVELAPGDRLYLPPGSWHTTQASETSVAVSVSPPRAPALGFVLRTLELQLSRVPELRRDLVLPRAGAGPLPAELRGALDACLAAIARASSELDHRSLHRAWALQAHRVDTERSAIADVPTIRRKDTLEHTDARGFLWMVAAVAGREVVCLYRDGAEWTLPIDARGFVEALAVTPRFVAEHALQWDRRLDWDATRDVLAQLVRVGVLEQRTR